ncbi:hypothetical protein HMPREF1869_01725 [Bacteroidales bacterium KA00251]|nr:hypothetical protein HMPREF1869_01725 [Bacteroidales bacterium KA00251]
MRVNHIQHLLPSDLNPIYLCKRAPPYLKRKKTLSQTLYFAKVQHFIQTNSNSFPKKQNKSFISP